MSENLENIWRSVTAEFPKSVSASWWLLIADKYGEKGRIGHNFLYLEEKLKEFENFKKYIKNTQAFIFAIFFQYLEYNPRDSECHEKNIQHFCKFANETKINEESEVYKAVISLLESSAVHSTDEHKVEGAFGEDDLHYFLDLDMCILGSNEKKYAQYLENIHNEYSFLDPATYTSLRKKVLQSFLLIPNIFATKEFREKFDAQARKNIQEELNGLTKSIELPDLILDFIHYHGALKSDNSTPSWKMLTMNLTLLICHRLLSETDKIKFYNKKLKVKLQKQQKLKTSFIIVKLPKLFNCENQTQIMLLSLEKLFCTVENIN